MEWAKRAKSVGKEIRNWIRQDLEAFVRIWAFLLRKCKATGGFRSEEWPEMTHIFGGSLWLLCWEETTGKVDWSREISEEAVATLDKGEGQGQGFDQIKVTCDQNLDIVRGQICHDWLWIEWTSWWLPTPDKVAGIAHYHLISPTIHSWVCLSQVVLGVVRGESKFSAFQEFLCCFEEGWLPSKLIQKKRWHWRDNP